MTGQSCACSGTRAWARSITLLIEAPLKVLSSKFLRPKRAFADAPPAAAKGQANQTPEWRSSELMNCARRGAYQRADHEHHDGTDGQAETQLARPGVLDVG